MHFSFISKGSRPSFVLLIYLRRVWIFAFLGLFALFPLAHVVFLFELSVYYIRLRTQRSFCMGHTINTHYHSYVLLSWWKKTIYEEIRLSQFFQNLFYYHLKITYALKKMNHILRWPSSLFWLHGSDTRRTKCRGQCIYVSTLPPPSLFVHTYSIHHFDSLYKQTVLIFFKSSFHKLSVM